MNRFLLLVLIAVAVGCVSRSRGTDVVQPADARASATTRPVLYHRTGGFAGTDDRVVIWPDGFFEVTGKILPSAAGRVPPERMETLRATFAGWSRLKDQYLAPGIADAYVITIHYGDNSVEASDLAPDLPEQFRRAFTEIESIAAAAAASGPAPAPAAP